MAREVPVVRVILDYTFDGVLREVGQALRLKKAQWTPDRLGNRLQFAKPGDQSPS
jgi:hypothetical protein